MCDIQCSFICVTCLLHMCDTTSYMWQRWTKWDVVCTCLTLTRMCNIQCSFICVIHFIHICDTLSHILCIVSHIWIRITHMNDMSDTWDPPFIRVIHFIHMCDTMLHMFMGHVMHRISTLILYHLCMFDMTHSCTRHDSFTCESYSQTCSFTDMCNIVSHMWIKCTLSHTHTDSINLIHMCDTMSHLCISHVRDLIEICQTYEWVMAHVRMRARERPRGYARERPTKVKRRGSYIYI